MFHSFREETCIAITFLLCIQFMHFIHKTHKTHLRGSSEIAQHLPFNRMCQIPYVGRGPLSYHTVILINFGFISEQNKYNLSSSWYKHSWNSFECDLSSSNATNRHISCTVVVIVVPAATWLVVMTSLLLVSITNCNDMSNVQATTITTAWILHHDCCCTTVNYEWGPLVLSPFYR
jgi:hypothetical protein